MSNHQNQGGDRDSASHSLGQPSQHPDGFKLKVFLAEDNKGDVFLVHEALEVAGLEFALTVREDGEQGLDYIEAIESGTIPCPDIVLLDLNLPKRNGSALLQRIRGSSRLCEVPVVIVTSSDAPQDRADAARLGATSYFRKPSDYDAFMSLGSLVKSLVLSC